MRPLDGLGCEIDFDDREMNRNETALFVGFITVYLPTVGLYHLMVFKVNKQLPQTLRIPHSLVWGGWRRLQHEYQRYYPSSSLYQLAVSGALVCLLVAFAMFVFCFWEYITGK